MLYRLLLTALCLATSAWAFPTGVGSCDPNPLKSPHVTTFSGSLASFGSANVKINGSTLNTTTAFSMKAGTSFPIELSSTEGFAGFLIRISKSGVNTKTYLGKGTSTNVQVPTLCTSKSLGGLGHNNKLSKTLVKGTIIIPSIGSGFKLHVTIVKNKQMAYQSVFTVNAV